MNNDVQALIQQLSSQGNEPAPPEAQEQFHDDRVGGHGVTPGQGAIPQGDLLRGVTEGGCAESDYEMVDIRRTTAATHAPYNRLHVCANARGGAL